MKSFSDKTEIRKSKLFDRVTLENESKINKRVGSNKNMYAGKKCQKLKRVYMFIKQTRVLSAGGIRSMGLNNSYEKLLS